MRWSRTLASTLREPPQDAEIESHKLLLRAGLVRRLSGGLYTFLPLGLRALRKVERIVREEMDRAGALEILMPALQPDDLWRQSGRIDTMGPAMFRLKDRQDRTFILGPTHEEVVSDLVAHAIQSYRQVPCTLYQVQLKFRDEIRPRFGLMRAKEFIMKDAYSFDLDDAGAEKSYQTMFDAYTRIFERCGLRTMVVEADTGDMGGRSSHEFMVPAETGEDGLIVCAACHYAANQERAERRIPADATTGKAAAEHPPPTPTATPGTTTIDQVARVLDCAPGRLLKTLVYIADGRPLAAIMPGDRDLNESKFKRLLSVQHLDLADPDTIARVTGGPVGFTGPVGLDLPLYADASLEGVRDVATGANEADTHLLHVRLDRDAKVSAYADLAVVEAGDACPRCGVALELQRGIEVGHVFNLGTKYTDSFDVQCLDEEGKPRRLVMGCYGIGVTRTMQAIIEQHRDADGICWPVDMAPYTVGLLLLDPRDADCRDHARRIEDELERTGIDVLVDDREERPGVKFKDADLIGFPFRVVVGARSLARGGVEIRRRGTTENIIVTPETVTTTLADMIEIERKSLIQRSTQEQAAQ